VKKVNRRLVVVLGFIFVLISALGIEKAYAEDGDYPNAHLLVNANWVEEHIGQEGVYIIDVRKAGYDQGHIPTAVHLSIDKLVDEDHPVEGYLISKQKFEHLMQNLGVRNDQTIVIYDEGKETSATRMFYALEYYGHDNVRLLNGGYQAWLADQKEVSKEASLKSKGDFKATIKKDLMVKKEDVRKMIGKEEVVLFDVRSPEEYKGEKVLARRGGHIPSAVNLEWTTVLKDDEVPFFKEATQISKLLEGVGVIPEKSIVVYCHKANRASHMYYTLRLMGFEDITVYEGSWIEWGNDRNTPINNPSKQEKGLRSL
jgi:thiosulfate/3-mercaptopyruvate sulfurtransferase